MKNILAFICAGMLLLFLSCPGINSGTDGSAEDPNLAVPQNVVVRLLGGAAVNVSWEHVSNAQSYQVYRRVGDSAFTLLKGTGIAAAEFDDTAFPKDKELQYAVRSVQGSRFSQMSQPSNTVAVFVQNLQASKLIFNNKIELMWLPIRDPELEKYVVYRYTTVDASDYDFRREQTGNTYTDDEKIQMNTPYFYRVTWKKNSIEFGVDAPLVMGVYSSDIDLYEPNDDYKILEKAGISVFSGWDGADWTGAPLIFSFSDGNNGVETDTDWYKYKRIAEETVFVNIKLPEGTCFGSATSCLKLQFYYAGQFSPEQQIQTGISRFSFDRFNDTEKDLYFRVFPMVASELSVCGKYKVNISDKF